MDIVLGVSMTPTTVRMALVEGEKADGVTVDHDVFDINAVEGSATSSAADQVGSLIPVMSISRRETWSPSRGSSSRAMRKQSRASASRCIM